MNPQVYPSTPTALIYVYLMAGLALILLTGLVLRRIRSQHGLVIIASLLSIPATSWVVASLLTTLNGELYQRQIANGMLWLSCSYSPPAVAAIFALVLIEAKKRQEVIDQQQILIDQQVAALHAGIGQHQAGCPQQRKREVIMRRFLIVRGEDISGLSGVGTVGEGAQFSSGRVAWQWCRPPFNLGLADCIEDLLAVHGHNGDTNVVWLDKEESNDA